MNVRHRCFSVILWVGADVMHAVCTCFHRAFRENWTTSSTAHPVTYFQREGRSQICEWQLELRTVIPCCLWQSVAQSSDFCMGDISISYGVLVAVDRWPCICPGMWQHLAWSLNTVQIGRETLNGLPCIAREQHRSDAFGIRLSSEIKRGNKKMKI